MNPLRPLPVLFLNHTAKPGGGEIALQHLVSALDRSRFTPHVLFFEDGEMVQRLTAAGISVSVLPLCGCALNARKDTLSLTSIKRLGVGWATLGFIRQLARQLRRLRPAVVYTNSLKADVLGGVAARLAGIPCVWHVRDRIASDYLPSTVARAFRAAARVLPTTIIANSGATARTLRSGLIAPKSVHVVHDGTPLAETGPVNPPGSSAVTGENASRGTVFGLIGRFSPWKGQDVFLRAAALVLRRFPESRFVLTGTALFGEEEFERSCRELATTLGVEHAVTFRGFQQDVAAEMSQVDVVVHASTLAEPFGQVIIEAMAVGRPVIASDDGAVPEILPGDQFGLRVPPGRPEQLATAMFRLIENPSLAKALAEAGRQRAREHFTIRRTAADVEVLIARVVSPLYRW